MNLLDLKRRLQPLSEYLMPSESDGGNGSTGTSGASSSARGGNGSVGASGSSTSNYGSRQGFAGATSYGGGVNGGDGGSVGDGSDTSAGMAERAMAMADYFNALNPNTPITPLDALVSVLSRADPKNDQRAISEAGWTYGEVEALGRMGYGSLVGANSANPTGQTIANVIASKNVNDNVMPAVVGVVKSAVPGAALALGVAEQAGAVASGAKTFGQAATDFGVNLVGSTLASAINKQVGQAISPTFSRDLGWASTVSKALGFPGIPSPGAMATKGLTNALGLSAGSVSSGNTLGANVSGDTQYGNFSGNTSSSSGGGSDSSIGRTIGEWQRQPAGAVDYVGGYNSDAAINNLLTAFGDASTAAGTSQASKAKAQIKRAATGSISSAMDTIVGGRYNPDRAGAFNGFSVNSPMTPSNQHGWFS